MLAHAFDLSAQVAEAGGSQSLQPAWSTQQDLVKRGGGGRNRMTSAYVGSLKKFQPVESKNMKDA